MIDVLVSHQIQQNTPSGLQGTPVYSNIVDSVNSMTRVS